MKKERTQPLFEIPAMNLKLTSQINFQVCASDLESSMLFPLQKGTMHHAYPLCVKYFGYCKLRK